MAGQEAGLVTPGALSGDARAAALDVGSCDLAMADVHTEELRVMADSLDEVRGCLKAAIGWKSLSEGGRRDLLLRALHNAEGATRTLLRLDMTVDLTDDGAPPTA